MIRSKFIIIVLVSIISSSSFAMEKPEQKREHVKITRESMTDTSIIAWQYFLQEHKWQDLIKNQEPHLSGCGKIYELPNYLHRNHESFAIVDMSALTYAEPHYHPIGTEIYLVLQGKGLVVVGNQQQSVQEGDAVVIPPGKAHFTIPENDFVIAVLNLPAFTQEDYVKLSESDPAVEFDVAVFSKLCRFADCTTSNSPLCE